MSPRSVTQRHVKDSSAIHRPRGPQRARRAAAARWAIAVYGVLLSGCLRELVVAELVDLGSESPDAASPAPDYGLEDLCENPAAPLMHTAAEPLCASTLPRQYLRHAVCTCRNLLASRLNTFSFDSRVPDSAFESWGAAVGLNTGLATSGGAGWFFTGNIGGSLVIGSVLPFSTPATLTVSGDLKLDGDFTLAGQVNVGRDAWLRSGLTGAGTLNVARDLYVRGEVFTGDQLPFVNSSGVAGQVHQLDFDIPAPCDCSASGHTDIADVVGRAASAHDNARAGLAADGWLGLDGARNLDLVCGRQYLRGMAVENSLAIEVAGRSALFVDGHVRAGGALSIVLQPDAELDLFIAGDLDVDHLAVFGDPRRPQALRVYVAGSAPLRVVDPATFGAGLYAPAATLSVENNGTLSGSLFVERLLTSGTLRIDYDRALSVEPASCASEAACADCAPCGALVCQDAQCGACVEDADCCQPWTCTQGRCVPIGDGA